MPQPSVLPKTQTAVELVGPGAMRLNPAKGVPEPGPHQFVARVEAVGLCFSDLKLLKQFDQHVRKSVVTSGIAPEVLDAIPSYVPGTKPTVPGHEVVCRVVAVGPGVSGCHVGDRLLVQPDFRSLKTAGANAAFGYNFEGALQQYVLLDERVLRDESGEPYVLRVREELGASQAALAEPWACVEDSYVTEERQAPLTAGRVLLIVDEGTDRESLEYFAESMTGHIDVYATNAAELRAYVASNATAVSLAPTVESLEALASESYDDIIACTNKAEVLEAANRLLATRGIMNVVLGGRRIGRPVAIGLGRMHYGTTRWIGTQGHDPSESYGTIPANGEVRDGDKVLVVGAGGPMGQMHVIRALFLGRRGLEIVAVDRNDHRLEMLERKAGPIADARGVRLRTLNTDRAVLDESFSYVTVMAPVGEIVADAIARSLRGAMINIFAGIPAPVTHPVDLDTMIARQVFVFGTSGSTLEDMKIVLRKVESDTLDTDASVDAISGMAGALDGIAAVENHTMAGKIIVYPQLVDVPLIALERLGERFPTVAAKLRNGQWNREAERELLHVTGAKR